MSLQDDLKVLHAERFWKKVNKDGPVPPHCPELGPCWIWTASVRSNGYGQFRYFGKPVVANKVALLLNGTVIPDGIFCCHKCDNPICVNPSHQFLGTHQDNMSDCVKKGRLRPQNGLAAIKRTPRPIMPRGEANAQSKLLTDQVREILRTPKSYGSGRVLARKFGVTEQCIWSVRSRTVWKHINV